MSSYLKIKFSFPVAFIALLLFIVMFSSSFSFAQYTDDVTYLQFTDGFRLICGFSTTTASNK
jgi:hypothetical protein